MQVEYDIQENFAGKYKNAIVFFSFWIVTSLVTTIYIWSKRPLKIRVASSKCTRK